MPNAKPMMERRHFELIARTIRNIPLDMNQVDPAIERACIAHHFVASLYATNPSFSRARFLAACGVEE